MPGGFLSRSVSWLRGGTALAVTAAFLGCVGPGGGLGGQGSRAGTEGGVGVGAGSADSGACVASRCVPLECGTGMLAVPLPGECCPTMCVPSDCSTVDCPPLQCAPGAHAVKPAHFCCELCVTNPPPLSGESCDQGQQGYADYLARTTTALGAASCNADSECRILVIDNPCDHGCGAALGARTGAELRSLLSDYAAAHCAACPQTGPGCPPVEQRAFCTGGFCSGH